MSKEIIKNICVEVSNDLCQVDIDMLEETLLRLPAGLYLELFNKMKNRINKVEENIKE